MKPLLLLLLCAGLLQSPAEVSTLEKSSERRVGAVRPVPGERGYTRNGPFCTELPPGEFVEFKFNLADGTWKFPAGASVKDQYRSIAVTMSPPQLVAAGAKRDRALEESGVALGTWESAAVAIK